jgi:YD repeat-containing protein
MEIAPVHAGSLMMLSRFTRDLTGRISTITALATNNNWTYAYDDLGRLTTATNAGDATQSETFTYAGNDNLLSRSRNPLGAGAPAGKAPYVYTYPADKGCKLQSQPSFFIVRTCKARGLEPRRMVPS